MRQDFFFQVGWHRNFQKFFAQRGLKVIVLFEPDSKFGVVPRYLVGYRATPGNMSTNSLQMFRSTELVLGEYRGKYPAYADAIERHLRAARHWWAYRAAATGRAHDARILIAQALRHHPLAASWHFSGLALSIARGRLQRRLGRPPPWPLYTDAIW